MPQGPAERHTPPRRSRRAGPQEDLAGSDSDGSHAAQGDEAYRTSPEGDSARRERASGRNA